MTIKQKIINWHKQYTAKMVLKQSKWAVTYCNDKLANKDFSEETEQEYKRVKNLAENYISNNQ